MSNYIDLVLAKHDNNDKIFLFKAPSGTYINEGERVVVETKKGDTPATVVGVSSYENEDGNLVKMVAIATGATFPLKRVLSRYKSIDWPEENEEISTENIAENPL